MSGFVGRMVGKVWVFVRQIGLSDVLIVVGSVSLYYGLWLLNPAVGFVVIGVIWMGIGLAAAWRGGK